MGLVVLGLLAWLGGRYHYQADWTAAGRNTLSETSRQLLLSLQAPARVTAYARDTPLLRRHISALLARYQRYKSDLTLEFVNPDDVPDQVRELGIAVEGELVVHYLGKQAHVDALTEQALTSALYRVARDQARLVLFITGHGERDVAGGENWDLRAWVDQLRSSGFTVNSLDIARLGSVPDNTAVLVIASPSDDYMPGEAAAIERYLAKGGNMLWLNDPDAPGGLESVANYLGVEFLPGLIVDPTLSQLGAKLFGTDDPRVTLVSSDGLARIDPGFRYNTLFPVAAALRLKPDGVFAGEAFLTTQSAAWRETGAALGEVTFDPKRDEMGPLDVGLVLTRERPAGEESGTTPSVAAERQRIVVIGDGDFVSNAFLGAAGNQELGLAVMNWLAQDDLLVAIPPETAPDLKVELSNFSAFVLAAGWLFVLPAALMATGTIVVWRRRRR